MGWFRHHTKIERREYAFPPHAYEGVAFTVVNDRLWSLACQGIFSTLG